MMKSLAAGVAALVVFGSGIGASTTGVNSPDPAAPGVRLAVFDVPLAPVAAVPVPTTEQLAGVLNGLADPAVPFADKTDLVEGGVGPTEAAMADHKLHKAARKGQLPLSFSVDNIQPADPGEATADVTVSGPKLTPRTMDVTFVNQDGWKLSMASAVQLVQAASEK